MGGSSVPSVPTSLACGFQPGCYTFSSRAALFWGRGGSPASLTTATSFGNHRSVCISLAVTEEALLPHFYLLTPNALLFPVGFFLLTTLPLFLAIAPVHACISLTYSTPPDVVLFSYIWGLVSIVRFYWGCSITSAAI